MDKTLQRLASKLATFIACSPQSPRSDALGRAEALAQELLSVLRNDLEPELLIDRRGRRPPHHYHFPVAAEIIQQEREDKGIAEAGEHVEVQPPTGDA